MSAKEQLMIAEGLALELAEMREDYATYGSLVFPPIVRQFYEQWYFDNDKEGAACHENMSHWFNRKASHVLRILMSFMAGSGNNEVTMDHLDRTLALLETIEVGISGIYSKMSDNPYEKRRNVILESMERYGKEIALGDLWPRIRHAFKDKAEFDESMESLVEMGQVARLRMKGRGTRPITMFKLLRRE